MNYGFSHQGTTYFPDGNRAEEDETNCEARNRELAEAEIEFVLSGPERMFVYVDRKKAIVTTWNGEKLGDVIRFGAEYKVPAFGWPSTRVAIRIKAINGMEYYGTWYKSSGDYARVRLVSRAKKESTR